MQGAGGSNPPTSTRRQQGPPGQASPSRAAPAFRLSTDKRHHPVWAAFARTGYRRFGIRSREFSDMVGLEIRQGQDVAAGEGYSQEDAEARLSRDVASWSEAVDRVLRGGTTPQERVSVMTTPLVFRLVGAGLLPVEMDAKKIVRILEEHHLSADLLKQVPKALVDPIAIFESDASGRYRGLVSMLDLQNADGSTIVAALHLDFSSERKGLKVNRLASAYGKGGVGGPDDRWFRTQVEKGNTRYVNKTKSSLWFGRAGIDFTGGANLKSLLDCRRYRPRRFLPRCSAGQETESAEHRGSPEWSGLDVFPDGVIKTQAVEKTFNGQQTHPGSDAFRLTFYCVVERKSLLRYHQYHLVGVGFGVVTKTLSPL